MKWRHKERRAATPQLVQTTPRELPELRAETAMVPIQLETVGGTGETPIAFYVGEGAVLPPGMFLSVDGILSGTPTLPGTYIFTVDAVEEGEPTPFLSTLTGWPLSTDKSELFEYIGAGNGI